MINFDTYGQDITKELNEIGDVITCAHSSKDYLALGTQQGFIHILDIVNRIVSMIGPYAYIKHISALENLLAFLTPEEVVVYDMEEEGENLRFSVSNYELVAVCGKHGPKAGVICGSDTELVGVTRGWLRTSAIAIKVKVEGLKDLKVHFHLLCVLDRTALKVYRLESEQLLWSFPMLTYDHLVFYWISAENLAIISDDNFSLVKYVNSGAGTFETVKTMTIPSVPCSMGGFNQKYLVYVDRAVLYMIDIERVDVVKAELPFPGLLVTSSRKNAPFFIIGRDRLAKVNPQSAHEKVLCLLKQGEFREGILVAQQYSVHIDRALQEYLEYSFKNEELAGVIKLVREIMLPQKLYTGIVNSFIERSRVNEVILDVPPESVDKARVLKLLIAEGDSGVIDGIVQKWPIDFFLTDEVAELLINTGFERCIIELHLKTKHQERALLVALSSHSHESFNLLENYPTLSEFFVINKQSINSLFEVNREKAADYFIANRVVIGINTVISSVSESLIAPYITSVIRLENNEEIETQVLHILLVTNSMDLPFFITNAKFLNLNEALRMAKKYSAAESQFLILKRLGLTEEAQAILAKDFEIRLKYIKGYPDLWPLTFAQAMENPHLIPIVLEQLKYHSNPIEFLDQISLTGTRAEMLGLIESIKTHQKLYSASSKAFKHEITELFNELCKEQSAPIIAAQPLICGVCLQPLTGAIYIRKCGHHSHASCSPSCLFCKDLL